MFEQDPPDLQDPTVQKLFDEGFVLTRDDSKPPDPRKNPATFTINDVLALALADTPRLQQCLLKIPSSIVLYALFYQRLRHGRRLPVRRSQRVALGSSVSVEAYYQEAGRAGRDGRPARAVMLAMRGDLGRLVQFIRNAELGPLDVERTLRRLRAVAQDGVAFIDVPAAPWGRAREPGCSPGPLGYHAAKSICAAVLRSRRFPAAS